MCARSFVPPCVLFSGWLHSITILSQIAHGCNRFLDLADFAPSSPACFRQLVESPVSRAVSSPVGCRFIATTILRTSLQGQANGNALHVVHFAAGADFRAFEVKTVRLRLVS